MKNSSESYQAAAIGVRRSGGAAERTMVDLRTADDASTAEKSAVGDRLCCRRWAAVGIWLGMRAVGAVRLDCLGLRGTMLFAICEHLFYHSLLPSSSMESTNRAFGAVGSISTELLDSSMVSTNSSTEVANGVAMED
nr:hypothetical protein Iba_chr14eCG8560 [Ipomoea batatas]